MTSTRLAWSLVLSVVLLAGCGSSPAPKKRDSGADEAGAAGSGGVGGTSGMGGVGGTSGMGGVGGTSGMGGIGGGVVIEPPGIEAGVPDATADAGTDTQADGGDAGGDAGDASTDAVEAGIVCTNVCVVGDKRCTAAGLETCALVNGCPAWGTAVACGANRTCTGTGAAAACTCDAPPAGCTAAGNFCMGTGARATCAQDANGCFSITATKTCGARQTCTGTLPTADCTCAAGPAGCAAAGTFCSDTDKFATCAQDTDGCFFKMGADTTCTSGQVCVASGATAACGCPAIGTAVGTGCATVGVTSCGGNTVLTCTAVPNSTCRVWAATTDCGANSAGLTCGTKGGGAACQCPEVTNGNYYVDPTAGSDTTTAGIFPTGAQLPAGCRLRTLSKAVNTVITSGNKIIAQSATLPAVFTEAASITVPAGVTLTTNDTVATPANYKLSFTGSTGTAVVLSNGSALSGFTIENGNTANAANPAAALGCLVGTVTVSGVALKGTSANGMNVMATGLQIGTMPVNTCTGTFTGLDVEGFATGVSVNTSPATPPALNDSEITNNLAADVGLLISAGTLNAANLVIQPRVPGTAAGYGVIVRPASATIANFVGTNPSIQTTANTGLWLDTGGAGASAPQATISGGAILNPTGGSSSGIRVESGTLTINTHNNLGTQITGADEYGLEVLGGTVVITGATIAGTSLDGVHVTGGSVTLHTTTVRNSLQRNVWMNNGTVVIDNGSAITGAIDSGIFFAGGAGDTLTVGGSAGAEVDISANGGHGINLTGAGGTATVISVQRANIHDNDDNGVLVNLTANGTLVSVTDSNIYSNDQNGVVVLSAPSANATNMVTLDDLDIRQHTTTAADVGRGIWLHGNDAGSGDITATINNCRVHDNRDAGIVIDEDMPPAHTTTTRAALTNNDVYSNNATAANSVGGISFATSSELTVFTGNKIHGNGGDQVAFTAAQTGGGSWDLDPGSCTSTTAPRNQIYCYATGRVGLRTTNTLTPNPPAYTVDADRISWTNAAPEDIAANAAKRDFSQGADTTIQRANPCAALPNTCP